MCILETIRGGSRVGPWVVEAYAGHGTYGVVYRASRAEAPDSPPVALKLARFPQDPRFVREAELLTRVQHPSVPRLVDRGWWHAEDSEVQHPYLAMEWIQGRTLYDWASGQALSSRQVLRVVGQLTGALAALHGVGGLHRDVKGHNVLVEPGGRAVLMDFGSGTWTGAVPLTDRLMPPGTHEYRSPEALRFRRKHGEQHEARYQAAAADDVYALGVTAYRLVVGRYPPPVVDPPQPRMALIHLTSGLEPRLAALIERMLENEPAARGAALELSQEAEAVAAQASAEADMVLGAKRRPALVAVPARVEASSSDGKPAAGREDVWAEAMAGVGVLAAACAILGVGVGWSALVERQQAPGGAWSEQRDGGVAPDGGTKGLGDGTVTTRVEYGVPREASAKALALELPDEPLDGQMRPPCRSQTFIAINGGCWRKLEVQPPNCGDDEYEWKHGCYYPVMDRPGRPRTSKELR